MAALAVRSLRVVSHLAGGRITAKPLPGAEAEEGAHPIGDHHEAGKKLEEEHSPHVSAVPLQPRTLTCPPLLTEAAALRL